MRQKAGEERVWERGYTTSMIRDKGLDSYPFTDTCYRDGVSHCVDIFSFPDRTGYYFYCSHVLAGSPVPASGYSGEVDTLVTCRIVQQYVLSMSRLYVCRVFAEISEVLGEREEVTSKDLEELHYLEQVCSYLMLGSVSV